MARPGANRSVQGFEYETILLESERLDKPVELRNVVTDLDVYENLDKPYLTAKMLVVDNADLLAQADLLGAETVTIRIKSDNPDGIAFQKKFYINQVTASDKAGDHTQVHTFHMIEDIAYISGLKNVNRYYTGQAKTIISKIAQEFLGKQVKSTDNDKQAVKLIVPNLTPLEAIKWISNRTTTTDGYPFYVFSSLTQNKLFFNDLGSMLQEPVINPDLSYKLSSSSVGAGDENVKRRTIRQHKFSKNAEDLLTHIRKGLVGARYDYIDTINDKQKGFQFDVKKDVFDPLVSAQVLQANQSNFAFSEKYQVDGRSFNKTASKTITQVRGSGAYREVDTDDYTLSYAEANKGSDYKLEVISRAIDNYTKTGALTMVVDGLDFIDGDKHSTIGNNLRVEFLTTDPDVDRGKSRLDPKKSGDYLVYSSRHMFTKEGHNVSLMLIKIGNYRR